MLCSYGCGNQAIVTFKNGNHCCSKTTSSCPEMKKRNSTGVSSTRKRLGNNIWKNGHPRGMAGKEPFNKNKTYDELYGSRAKLIKEKISNALSGNSNWDNVPEETKQKISRDQRARIIARYEQGWMPKAGRCEKYSHSSPVAGNVSLDGTWELVVAQWLDLKGYNWRRNTKRFQYTNLKGAVSHYTPDFWVEGIGYVEVKGYKTKLDECKWSQFPENLTVWFRKDVDRIKEDLGARTGW